jgi:hypothetical protein
MSGKGAKFRMGKACLAHTMSACSIIHETGMSKIKILWK